jgi:TRAP-type C4-dicarboxylate transport system permease small subunit
MLPNALTGNARVALGVLIESAMLFTNVFMLWYGIGLVKTTWYQSIAEFPIVSVGVSYLPVPIDGAITVLFIIERMLTGNWFPAPHDHSADTISAE